MGLYIDGYVIGIIKRKVFLYWQYIIHNNDNILNTDKILLVAKIQIISKRDYLSV